mgnify:CR=1 FL=1
MSWDTYSKKQSAPKGKNHKLHYTGSNNNNNNSKKSSKPGPRDYANRAQSAGDRDASNLLRAYGISDRELIVSQTVQETIFDTLQSLHERTSTSNRSENSSSNRDGDSADTTATTTTAAAKQQRREKEMQKLENKVKEEEAAQRDALARKQKIGTSTKVRIVLCTHSLGNGPRKVLVIPREKKGLKQLLKMVKNKMTNKPHKVKKPQRAFVFLNGDEKSDPVEIKSSELLLDDEIVVVTDADGIVVVEKTKSSKKDKKKEKKEKKKAKKKAKKEAAAAAAAGLEPEATTTTVTVTDEVDSGSTSSAVDSTTTATENSPNTNTHNSRPRRSIIDASQSAGLKTEHDNKSNNSSFQAMLAARATLPAHDKRRVILDALATEQVVVVSGDTGCGKTTEIPQFILDDAIANGRGGECSIVCTQVCLVLFLFLFLFVCFCLP